MKNPERPGSDMPPDSYYDPSRRNGEIPSLDTSWGGSVDDINKQLADELRGRISVVEGDSTIGMFGSLFIWKNTKRA